MRINVTIQPEEVRELFPGEIGEDDILLVSAELFVGSEFAGPILRVWIGSEESNRHIDIDLS